MRYLVSNCNHIPHSLVYQTKKILQHSPGHEQKNKLERKRREKTVTIFPGFFTEIKAIFVAKL